MAGRRKIRGAMFVLTTLGGLLMLPPLVFVFDQNIAHFGIPQIVFYLLALWLLLVIGTALLARAMPADAPENDDGER